MNKFSLRVLLVLVAVAGLTTACGKSNDAAATADQLNNGDGIGPSLVTRTSANGNVEVAFADQHITSEQQVTGMIDSGQLQFVPIEQVMQAGDDDFAIQPVNQNNFGSLEAKGNGNRNRARRRNRRNNAGNGDGLTRRQIRRIARRTARRQARRQFRRAARRSRWFSNNYVWVPNNYYSTVNWVAPTFVTPNTFVNNCQQYIAFQNSCYQPVSTSLNVSWNWRLNCNHNSSFVQVYF